MWETRLTTSETTRKQMRPGLLWRVAFWIGPAIGMSLADIVGRLTAFLVVGLGLVLIGYGVLVTLVVVAAASWLEPSRLEQDLRRKIHLKLSN